MLWMSSVHSKKESYKIDRLADQCSFGVRVVERADFLGISELGCEAAGIAACDILEVSLAATHRV
jgi:hypothetical protein